MSTPDETVKRRRRSRRRAQRFADWATQADNPVQGGSSGTGGFSQYALQDGADPRDTNSYRAAVTTQNFPVQPPQPTTGVPTSTAEVQPLPSGRSLQTLPGNSPELAARQKRLNEVFKNPEQFIAENVTELNQDQSLLDKGMGFLESLFNYEDEADLQVFGIPMGIVEGVWDRFNRHYTGVSNLRDAGIAAVISAMPGGIRTLEWSEVSGDRSVLEVLNGEIGLEPNVAPSPMQVAIASVAVETKRIREGKTRLSDALLLNPAIAPFIMAGLAAETSPLQQDGFNIMDPEQRAAAFGDGWERFFSGFGDFGIQMADPMIAVAAGAKILQVGALATRSGRWGASVAETTIAGKRLRGVVDDVANDVPVEAPIDEVLKHLDPVLGVDGKAVPQTFGGFVADVTARGMRRAERTRAASVVRRERATRYQIPLEIEDADEFWDTGTMKAALDAVGVDKAKAIEGYRRGAEIDQRMPGDANYENLTPADQRLVKWSRRMDDFFADWSTKKIVEQAALAGEDVPPLLLGNKRRVTFSADEKGIKNPMSRMIVWLAQVDAKTGKKVRSAQEIMNHKSFRRNPDRMKIANMLHSIEDPNLIALSLMALHGSQESMRILSSVRPAIADDLFRLQATRAITKSKMHPTKYETAKKTLEDSRTALRARLSAIENDTRLKNLSKQMAEADPGANSRVTQRQVADTRLLDEDRLRLQQSIDEIDVLLDYMETGVPPDSMKIGDMYKPEKIEEYILDLYQYQDDLSMVLTDELSTKAPLLIADRDARMIMGDNWYARMVARSRERSARARHEYLEEGSGLIPRRVPKSMIGDVNGARFSRRWEWGFISGSEFGTNRLRRAARVWRWASEGTPAGYVGIKGNAIQGADEELRATLDLDIYNGEPIKYRRWSDEKNDWEDGEVGGRARREMFMKMLGDAIVRKEDIKTVLTRIELEMESDFAKAYGVSEEVFKAHMRKADRYRAQAIDQVRQYGMYVDEDASLQHIPYLKQHLANGHYMHNWHHLEAELQRAAIDAYGSQAANAFRVFRKAGQIGFDSAKRVDEVFQTFWRPAVLFRASYTQRNLFEGLSRAMAYYGSLAPLAWPIQATYHGMSNKTRRAIVNATERKVAKKLPPAEFIEARKPLIDASESYFRVATAQYWLPDEQEWSALMADPIQRGKLHPGMEPPTEYMYYVFKQTPEGPVLDEILSPARHQKRMEDTYAAMVAQRAVLDPLEKRFDAAVENTKFGNWRKKQIDDLTCELGKAKALGDNLADQLRDVGAFGLGVGQVGAGAMELASLARTQTLIQAEIDTLRFDPAGAVKVWKGQAARERRIGSGDLIGPLGGTVMEPYGDEMDGINRRLLSSDTARRMTLAAQSERSESLYFSQTVVEGAYVPWDPAKVDEWDEALATIIEGNAWNPLIGVLVDSDMSVDAAVEWLLSSPAGKEHAALIRFLQGSDFETGLTERSKVYKLADGTIPEARAFERLKNAHNGETVAVRLKRMEERMRDPITGRFEQEQHLAAITSYVNVVASDLYRQLQFAPQFVALQRRRSAAMRDGKPDQVTAADVRAARESLSPEQMRSLSGVKGSVVIQSGASPFMEQWRKWVDKMFRLIGTIPEDAVVRGPFYAKRFKQVRNDLLINWWEQNGGIPPGVHRGRLSKGGKIFEDEMTHPETKIPADVLEQILEQSHAQALFDTREYLYTIERRTKLGKYGEYIWPFISATQNTVTAGGKLLYRNPWVAPVMYDLWATPQRLGYRDEEGNLTMPMPFRWVKDILEDAPDIPIIGGVVSGSDFISSAMNGLNVWAPDTGFFGVIPRPSALVQMTASNFMQAGIMPVETPEALKSIAGDNAEEMWSLFKDYIFGEDGSMSTRLASIDMALPAWARWFWNSKDEHSQAYAFHFAMEMAAQEARAKMGERKMPTPAEIHKRVTNKMLFYSWGAYGLPTPLTPYPILTRPNVEKPLISGLQEILSMYLSAQGKQMPDGTYSIEPGEAYRAFERDFGEDALPLAMAGGMVNSGGAQPTEATVADIKAYDHLIRDVADGLGDDLEILDILVNNSNGASVEYSDEAAKWQLIRTIPGVSEKWRKYAAPEEAEAQRQIDAGWIQYQKFMDGLDVDMYTMGLKNLQQAGAERLRNAKDVFLVNMAESNNAWWLEYSDGAANRTTKTVNLLAKMVNDPVVQRRMFEGGQESLYAAMSEYVYWRRTTARLLEEAVTDEDKAFIREQWANIRTDLKTKNERWKEIQNRWLDSDDNPTYAGEERVDLMTLEGAGVGE